ncbi:MAG: hypothetical protein ACOC7J_06460 [Armatimonadota bacterium]
MTTEQRQVRLQQLATLLADIEGALDRLGKRKSEVKAELSKLRGKRGEIVTPDGVTISFGKNTKRTTDDDALEEWLDEQPAETRELFTRLDTRKAAFDTAVKAGRMTAEERKRFEKTSYGTPCVTVKDERPQEAAHTPALELLREAG